MIEVERGPAPADIDLSREAEFSLGEELRVSPSTREVRRNGSVELLEPRVMQVLVALVKAGGAVVSREDLYDGCWGGRTVGEDALQRSIARLRRFAEHNGGANFVVETIPRVGYRLIPAEGAKIPKPPEAASGTSVWRRVLRGAAPWAVAALDSRGRRRVLCAQCRSAALAIGRDEDGHFRRRPWSGGPPFRWTDRRSPIPWTTPNSIVDIYIRRLGDATSRRLTSGPGFKFAPAWSCRWHASPT